MDITFSSDTRGFSRRDVEITSQITEEYFHTSGDPTQAAPTDDKKEWIVKSCQQYLNIIRDRDTIIGYSFMIPCSKKLMKDFVTRKINEEELFDAVMKEKIPEHPESIYLCAAIIKEEYRGNNLAKKGFLKMLERLKNTETILFAWPTSKQGKDLARKISEEARLPLFLRGQGI